MPGGILDGIMFIGWVGLGEESLEELAVSQSTIPEKLLRICVQNCAKVRVQDGWYSDQDSDCVDVCGIRDPSFRLRIGQKHINDYVGPSGDPCNPQKWTPNLRFPHFLDFRRFLTNAPTIFTTFGQSMFSDNRIPLHESKFDRNASTIV